MSNNKDLIQAHVERLRYTKQVQEEALASTTEQLAMWERVANGDREPLARMRVEILGLTNRIYNALYQCGIEKIGQLTILTEDAVRAIPDIGGESLNTIRSALKELGLEFSEPLRVQVKKKVSTRPNLEQIKKQSIRSIGLQGWVENDLLNEGIDTIEKLIAETRHTLMKRVKLGAAGTNHVEYKLGQMGFRLAK